MGCKSLSLKPFGWTIIPTNLPIAPVCSESHSIFRNDPHLPTTEESQLWLAFSSGPSLLSHTLCFVKAPLRSLSTCLRNAGEGVPQGLPLLTAWITGCAGWELNIYHLQKRSSLLPVLQGRGMEQLWSWLVGHIRWVYLPALPAREWHIHADEHRCKHLNDSRWSL
jgi:hypothetical protein